MKNKFLIIKIILIFLLLIATAGTGIIGVNIKNVFLFTFGNTYYWVSILSIMYVLITFFKKKQQKHLKKYWIAIFLMFLSLDILITLVKLGQGQVQEPMVLMQSQMLFKPDNIADGIGIIQMFFLIILYGFFGRFGVFIGCLTMFLVGVSLVIDLDIVIMKFMTFIKELFSKDKKDTSKQKLKDTSKGLKVKNSKKDKAKIKNKKIFEEPKEENKINKETQELEPKTTRSEKHKKQPSKFKSVFEPLVSKTSKDIPKEKDKQDNKESISTAPVDNKDDSDKYGDLFEMKIPIKGRDKKSENLMGNDKNTLLDKELKVKDEKYKMPSLDLLESQKNNDKKYEILKKEALEKEKKLSDALESFKLKASIKNVIVGASVTKYELEPEPGQKVNKFLTLSNDLSMALEAKSIRIEAPIPGKSLVGIEVDNKERMMVGLKEILQKQNRNFNKLEVGLGQDITGKSKYLDIAQTPHLLIAGATGSGKSVCINSIIVSILLKARPEDVKFLLVDPKKVELTPYDGIPHLLAPVLTDASKAAVALNKLVIEMEKRYELFTGTKTRNIQAYNKAVSKKERLPYIVAIIDELADLMMVASSEIETSISRLAQKARAAGIHMILATQRPSTDVITGLIKSNIPSRISFMVSSSIDSRTILDKKGAESLLGHGDMLLSRPGKPSFERIQGGYLSDKEIQTVVEFINSQFKEEEVKEYYEDDFVHLDKQTVLPLETESTDDLEKQAIQIGIEAGKISTSLIQRKLKIGYNKAANIMEDLEAKGYVTTPEGNKAREIIIERVNEDDQQDNQ